MNIFLCYDKTVSFFSGRIMQLDDCTTSRSCNSNAVYTYLCNIELFIVVDIRIVQNVTFAEKKRKRKHPIDNKPNGFAH